MSDQSGDDLDLPDTSLPDWLDEAFGLPPRPPAAPEVVEQRRAAWRALAKAQYEAFDRARRARKEPRDDNA